MSNRLKFAIVAAVLAAGIAMAPAVYAHEPHHPESAEDPAAQGGMSGSGMMQGGDMMGMMTMMTQMTQMMEACNNMMQTAAQSPDQRQPQPSPGDGAPAPQE